YLRAALTAPESASSADDKKPDGPLGPAKEMARALDVEEVPEALVTPEKLRDAGVVILANCGALNATHFDWLRTYVLGGGGLLVFPGDRVNPDVYNTQFFPVPGPQNESLTGVRLGPPEGDPEKADTFERLSVIDFTHPALTVFDDPEARYLKSLRFYRRIRP